MPYMHNPDSSGQVLSWATDLDDRTLEQAERSASLPIVPSHIALMPDAHFGYGATVGSVIPTAGAVIPSAVGVDIGCGMIGARLPLTSVDLPDDLQRLNGMIARDVPAGVGQGHSARHRTDEPSALPTTSGESWWTPKLASKAHDQFGSLGSGNHFVEVCLDEADRVWIVLHSGSRGVGNQLVDLRIDTAKALAAAVTVGDLAELPDRDLAWLSEGSVELDAYITDMLWARFLGRDLGEVPIADEINCHQGGHPQAARP